MKNLTYIIVLFGTILFLSCGNREAKNLSIMDYTNEIENPIKQENSENHTDCLRWNGTYIDKYDRTLKVKNPNSKGVIQFEITPLNTASCMEDKFSGTAYLTKEYVASYNNNDCTITFTLNDGEIQISEYDCDYIHGAACLSFDGIYYKRNK